MTHCSSCVAHIVVVVPPAGLGERSPCLASTTKGGPFHGKTRQQPDAPDHPSASSIRALCPPGAGCLSGASPPRFDVTPCVSPAARASAPSRHTDRWTLQGACRRTPVGRPSAPNIDFFGSLSALLHNLCSPNFSQPRTRIGVRWRRDV